jgi:hypothetical protein
MSTLRHTFTVGACGLLLLGAGAALASGDPGRNNGQNTSNSTGATTTTGAPKGKAYGYYCRAESKTHVAGQKGTPFSQCVTAMAKLDHNSSTSAKAACALLSKKHVKGQKGTPFSACISAAAKLRHLTS